MNIVELERTLWATADKLRANMDTDEEVFYVLLAHKII
jgi:type I restriction-modification system DNA methylase subunit